MPIERKRKRALTVTDFESPSPKRLVCAAGPTDLGKLALKNVQRLDPADLVATWVVTERSGSFPRGVEVAAESAFTAMSSTTTGKRSRRSKSASNTETSCTTALDVARSISDPNVRQILIDNNINGPLEDNDPPLNLDEIQRRMDQPRPSCSPSVIDEKAFQKFRRAQYDSLNEEAFTMSHMHYFPGSANYKTAHNTSFRFLKDLTPSARMPNVKPDVFSGVAPKDIPKPIRDDIGEYILSTTGPTPALVNDFTEFKGLDGKYGTALNQVAYDGAAGARAMHKMRTYGLADKTDSDGVARTFVTTHSPDATNFYASYSLPSQPDTWHTYCIGGEATLATAGQYRSALTKYRNVRDLAAEQRQEAIQIATSRLLRPKASSSPAPKRRIPRGQPSRPAPPTRSTSRAAEQSYTEESSDDENGADVA